MVMITASQVAGTTIFDGSLLKSGSVTVSLLAEQ
jgi:hypothetical protein